MFGLLGKFGRDKSANMAIAAALFSPVLFGGTGLAVDYAFFYNKSAKLQHAADLAALAAAKELGIAGTSEEQIRSVASNYAKSNFARATGQSDIASMMKVETSVSPDRSGLNVAIAYTWAPFFAHTFDGKVLPIRVSAKAVLASQASICTLSLDTSARGSLSLTGKSAIRARDCTVQANSADTQALQVPVTGKIQSETTCVTGGYAGLTTSYDPKPLTDCPAVSDPLSNRSFPTKTSCDFKEVLVADKRKTLQPGVYCGGLFITQDAEVTFQSGTYTFIDGDLDIGGGSTVKGKRVSLFFRQNSRLFVRNASTLDLSAPENGSMAGMLVAAHPSNDPDLVFEVQSDDAKDFTGLIYTPNNTFKLGDDVDGDGECDLFNDPPLPEFVRVGLQALGINIELNFGRGNDPLLEIGIGRGAGNNEEWKDLNNGKKSRPSLNDLVGCLANVGQYSDWTAIVARNVLVTSGVDLVLNADYAGSEVPVPANNGVIGTRTRLAN
ncbi:MAG: hypothetical protein JJ891_16340 [Rhizobiaceae bacterium]|nr:hypothetical protein [Rhizobiaceae bacterium]